MPRESRARTRGLFDAVMKDQRHAVASGKDDELSGGRDARLRGPEDDRGQFPQSLPLLFGGTL